MITEIDEKLLEKIADLTASPWAPSTSARTAAARPRQSTEHIDIVQDGKPGIDIRIKPGTKNESVHIPVIISKPASGSGLQRLLHRRNCDVDIVAGCGIHNCGCDESRHDGIHTFHVGKNAKVRYVEKHYGEGDGRGKRVMNPTTIVYLEEGATMQMDTIQIRGIDSTKRETDFFCAAGARW